MIVEIKLPELSKYPSAEIEISTWYKKPGDSYEDDEPLAELLFDKAAFDLNASGKGKLVKIIIGEHCTGHPGDVIAVVEVDA